MLLRIPLGILGSVGSRGYVTLGRLLTAKKIEGFTCQADDTVWAIYLQANVTFSKKGRGLSGNPERPRDEGL